MCCEQLPTDRGEMKWSPCWSEGCKTDVISLRLGLKILLAKT